MKLLVDTSSFAKRYIQEAGSEQLDEFDKFNKLYKKYKKSGLKEIQFGDKIMRLDCENFTLITFDHDGINDVNC